MRHLMFAWGLVLTFAFAAAAQEPVAPESSMPENPAYARLMATPYFSLVPGSGAAAASAPLGIMPGMPISTPPGPAGNASPATPAADPPQGVQGVFVNYNWQAYFGYTFTRFYQVPHTQLDTNGFNYSMVYYFLNWFGLDGEFAATHTSQFSYDGWLLFGGGGPRFRWEGPRGIELWGHVMFGYSHFTPQTSFGAQDAFAYTAGGGGDINIRHTRWALRMGAEMLATRYFGTYQFSPKAFGGVVFKF